MPPRSVAPVVVDQAFVPQSDCALPDGDGPPRRACLGPDRGTRFATSTQTRYPRVLP